MDRGATVATVWVAADNRSRTGARGRASRALWLIVLFATFWLYALALSMRFQRGDLAADPGSDRSRAR